MAELVATFGVPHAPIFPEQVERGEAQDVVQLYQEVAQHLDAVQPDVLVIFDSDHVNTFFVDNLPIFSVGVGETTAGPNDLTRMPRYEGVPLDPALALHLRDAGIRDGFDLALLQDFEVDHSVLVPLHFMTPRMHIPIVPFYINGLVPPIPAAKRCYALGQSVREAIASWTADMRVAVLASGVFSLDLGSPRSGGPVPDPEWTERVTDHLAQGRVAQLLDEATAERMWQAGNIGGELLNWVAMLGVVGDRRPRFIQARDGDAFGAWRWD
ncbi:MAG: extradiol ring-cleavage dioxygenase [Dehalococcoidia bacterium]